MIYFPLKKKKKKFYFMRFFYDRTFMQVMCTNIMAIVAISVQSIWYPVVYLSAKRVSSYYFLVFREMTWVLRCRM